MYRFKAFFVQRGINLIEIMVAMAIGLFLVLGATTLYVHSKKSSDVDDVMGLLQESARYVMSIMEADVRMANYWGLKKDGSDIDNLHLPPNSSGTQANSLSTSTDSNYCGAAYAVNTAAYIEATNDSYSFSCTPNTTAATSADTLTVRRAETVTSAVITGRLQVCSTHTSAVVINGDASTCAANAEIHNIIVDGYYIDNSSDQNPNLPSLRRKTLGVKVGASGGTPSFSDVEIAAGVEDMQIELGWDNNPSNNANNPSNIVDYLQPGDGVLATATPGRIVAVRVWLLMRAEKPDITFVDNNTYSYANRTGAATTTLTAGRQYTPGDHYRRLLVSRTFFVRNVTGT